MVVRAHITSDRAVPRAAGIVGGEGDQVTRPRGLPDRALDVLVAAAAAAVRVPLRLIGAHLLRQHRRPRGS
jgi:hypothetical protein